MPKSIHPDQVLRGSHKTWGIWERLVPSLIADNDTAGQRMKDIHVRRDRTAEQFVAQKRVLDIACGTGYGSRMLKDAGAVSVTGVDLSSEAVAYATATYQCDGVSYHEGNAEEYTSTRQFDVVTSFETLEHLPNPEVFLGRMRDCLAPGGTLLISVPIGETRHIDGFHLHVFEREDIYRILAEAGFLVHSSRFDDWQVSMKEMLRLAEDLSRRQAAVRHAAVNLARPTRVAGSDLSPPHSSADAVDLRDAPAEFPCEERQQSQIGDLHG